MSNFGGNKKKQKQQLCKITSYYMPRFVGIF